MSEPAYHQRVVLERAELDKKMQALAQFSESAIFGELSDEEKFRLTVQLGAMALYHAALDARIAAFKPIARFK